MAFHFSVTDSWPRRRRAERRGDRGSGLGRRHERAGALAEVAGAVERSEPSSVCAVIAIGAVYSFAVSDGRPAR